ncbi:MAG: DUF6145 family protein [Butyrivibrio sp.]|jgi:hypothetical protein|nr:DUF6145 family protein [Butyrivibrio sp.]
MSNEEKNTKTEFQDEATPETEEKKLHAETLNDKVAAKKEKRRLVINKESGKVLDAETGEAVTDIQVVTEDGSLGSISASGRIILCGANAYEKKYYFNPLFKKIPESIQKELHIVCVLFTQEAGGIFTIEFEDDGTVTMETNADEDDITYDEVSAGLLIGEVRRQRQDLFEAMQMYYRIYILKENPADILADEDE